MLSQLQFPGMPPARPRVVGEKSRPVPDPVEPHGDAVMGYAHANAEYPDYVKGDWRSHAAVGAGVVGLHELPFEHGEYDPEDSVPEGSWDRGPRYAEVPIQRADGAPVVYSKQEAGVSMERIRQLQRAPHTASGVPSAYLNPRGEVSIQDGNHRVTKALLENQMFQPMNVWS